MINWFAEKVAEKLVQDEYLLQQVVNKIKGDVWSEDTQKEIAQGIVSTILKTKKGKKND